MIRRLRLIVACLALALMTSAAHAEWLEASNKHFIVYGNISRSEMARFSERLERFGAAVRSVFRLPEPEGGAANRVTIYIVPTTGAVRRYYNGKGSSVAGFYHSDAQGSWIVTPATTEEGNEYFSANLVLFHEYAHHLILGNSEVLYPGWASEGLAEFFSTAMVDKKGAVKIGAAANARAESIMALSPMSVKDLLESDSRKLSEEDIDQKYSRGWLLSHYLMFGRKRPGQFTHFLTLVTSGVPTEKAGIQAFGDLGKLNGEINAYRTQQLLGVSIGPDHYTADPVSIRALDADEARLMPFRLESATGSSEQEAAKLLPEARKIAETNSRNAWIQRVLAEIEFDANNNDAAEAACDKALAIDPNNLMAMVYKARIHMRRAQAAKAADPAMWRDVRRLIVKANRIEPNYALPLVIYYSSYLMANERPSDTAVDGLLRAVQLAPQDTGLRVLAFGACLQQGDLPLARRMLASVAFDAHAKGDNPARAIIDLIDNGATIDAVREAATKAQLVFAKRS